MEENKGKRKKEKTEPIKRKGEKRKKKIENIQQIDALFRDVEFISTILKSDYSKGLSKREEAPEHFLNKGHKKHDKLLWKVEKHLNPGSYCFVTLNPGAFDKEKSATISIYDALEDLKSIFDFGEETANVQRGFLQKLLVAFEKTITELPEVPGKPDCRYLWGDPLFEQKTDPNDKNKTEWVRRDIKPNGVANILRNAVTLAFSFLGLISREFISTNGQFHVTVLYGREENEKKQAEWDAMQKNFELGVSDLESLEPVCKRKRPLRRNLYLHDIGAWEDAYCSTMKQTKVMQKLIAKKVIRDDLRESILALLQELSLDCLPRLWGMPGQVFSHTKLSETVDPEIVPLQTWEGYARYLESLLKKIKLIKEDFKHNLDLIDQTKKNHYCKEALELRHETARNVFKAYSECIKASRAKGVPKAYRMENIWEVEGVEPTESFMSYMNPSRSFKKNRKGFYNIIWKRFEINELGTRKLFSSKESVYLLEEAINDIIVVEFLKKVFHKYNEKISGDLEAESVFFPLHNYPLLFEVSNIEAFRLLEEKHVERLKKAEQNEKSGKQKKPYVTFDEQREILKNNEKQIQLSKSKSSKKKKKDNQVPLIDQNDQVFLLKTRPKPLETIWPFQLWNSSKLPQNAIRDYFGEKVTLYYVFVSYLLSFLLPISLLSIPVYLVQVWDEEANVTGDFDISTVYYSRVALEGFFTLVIVTWSNTLLASWKIHENLFAVQYGQTENIEEKERSEFQGVYYRSLETDNPNILIADKTRMLVTLTASALFAGLFLLLSMSMTWAIITLKYFIIKNNWLPDYIPFLQLPLTIPHAIEVLKVILTNRAYIPCAVKLTRWQNPRLGSLFESSIVVQISIFQILNISLSFGTRWLMLSFLSWPECYFQDCFLEARNFSRTYFVIKAIILIFKIFKSQSHFRIVKKLMIKELNSITEKAKGKSDPRYGLNLLIERQIKLDPFQEDVDFDNTTIDYSEILIDLIITMLFGATFPPCFIVLYFVSLLELENDKKTLLYLKKRPQPKKAASIGAWMNALRYFVLFSTLTNSMLFSFNEFIKDVAYKLIALISIIVLLIFLKIIIDFFYVKVPLKQIQLGIRNEMKVKQFRSLHEGENNNREENKLEVAPLYFVENVPENIDENIGEEDSGSDDDSEESSDEESRKETEEKKEEVEKKEEEEKNEEVEKKEEKKEE